MTCRSVRQTAQASTRTSNSPGAGSGTGFCTYRSGLVSTGACRSTTHARIVLALPTVMIYVYHGCQNSP